MSSPNDNGTFMDEGERSADDLREELRGPLSKVLEVLKLKDPSVELEDLDIVKAKTDPGLSEVALAMLDPISSMLDILGFKDGAEYVVKLKDGAEVSEEVAGLLKDGVPLATKLSVNAEERSDSAEKGNTEVNRKPGIGGDDSNTGDQKRGVPTPEELRTLDDKNEPTWEELRAIGESVDEEVIEENDGQEISESEELKPRTGIGW